MNWDDTRIFLAIARNGTLSGAAQALELGVATVSRRLDRLEASLDGMPLFSRHQHGYRLTDDGRTLLGQAEALEQAGRAFEDSAREQGRVTGCVRLATTDNIANAFIIPSLPDLFKKYPELRIELVSGVDTVNLHRGDADMAVRMVKPEVGNLTIRRLATAGFGVYGSPTYVAHRSSSDFEHDTFIGWVAAYRHLPAARWLTKTLQGRFCSIETATLTAQVAAAKAGLGLAVLPHFMGRLNALVCVQPQLGIDHDVWLAMHSDLAHTRRVRAIADHLIALFAAHSDSLMKADIVI